MAEASSNVDSSLGGLVKQGPVMSMMAKRLRALRKKWTRIVQIEEAKQQGKPINKEQEDVLKSKLSLSILIDEYEKLQKPLEVALAEELNEMEKEIGVSRVEEPHVDADAVPLIAVAEEPQEVAEKTEDPQPESTEAAKSESTSDSGSVDQLILDLLQLLYFSNLFDVRSPSEAHSQYVKIYERRSCLTYDYVTDDNHDTAYLLHEEDLDAISELGLMLTTRQPNSTLSHKDALQKCLEHAKAWLIPSNQNSGESYSRVRENLLRIISSDYFTVLPEMQPATTPGAQFVGEVEPAAIPSSSTTDEHTAFYSAQDATMQFYQPVSDYLVNGPDFGESSAAFPAGGDVLTETDASQETSGVSSLQPVHGHALAANFGAPGQAPPMLPNVHMGGTSYVGHPASPMHGAQRGNVGMGPRGGRGGYRGPRGGFDGNRGGRRGGRGHVMGGMNYFDGGAYGGGGNRGGGRGPRGGNPSGRGVGRGHMNGAMPHVAQGASMEPISS